jgi:regulator of sigma E protease
VIGAFPLGGYVKMLDEREGPCRRRAAPGVQHPAAAFARGHRGRRPDRQPAARGPALCRRQLVGRARAEPAGRPVAARWPSRPDCAAVSGRRAGSPTTLEPVRSFEDVRWLLTRGALDGRDLTLECGRRPARPARGRAAAQPASTRPMPTRSCSAHRPARPADPARARRRGGRRRGRAAGLRKGDLVLRAGATGHRRRPAAARVDPGQVAGRRRDGHLGIERRGRTLTCRSRPRSRRGRAHHRPHRRLRRRAAGHGGSALRAARRPLEAARCAPGRCRCSRCA